MNVLFTIYNCCTLNPNLKRIKILYTVYLSNNLFHNNTIYCKITIFFTFKTFILNNFNFIIFLIILTIVKHIIS